MIISNISLQLKLLLGFFSTTIITLLLVGGISFYNVRDQLRMITMQRLTSVRESKKVEIEDTFTQVIGQCLTFSESTMSVDTINQFKQTFYAVDVSDEELERYKKELMHFYEEEFLPKINETAATKKTVNDYFPNDRKTIIFQTLYLARNPHALKKKREYSGKLDGNAYDKMHAFYHAIYTKLVGRFDFSDIYFIDIDTGYVLFNIAKEIDFATNLLSGPLKDTLLAETFRDCQKTSDENYVKVTDFSFYDPSYGTPTAFIGTPVFYQGVKIGVLVFQFPINVINNIMTYNKRWTDVGLGQTGETYLRGQDKLMRSLSRFFVEDSTSYMNVLQNLHEDRDTIDKIKIYKTTILLQRVGDALEQISDPSATGIIIANDYLGKQVLLAYAPINIPGLSWEIIAKINIDEAFAPIQEVAKRTIFLLCVVLLVVLLFSIFLVYSSVRPFAQVAETIEKQSVVAPLDMIAEGNLGPIIKGYNKLVGIINGILLALASTTKAVQKANGDAELYNKTTQENIQQLHSIAKQIQTIVSLVQEKVSSLQISVQQNETALQTMTVHVEQISASEESAQNAFNEMYVHIHRIINTYNQIMQSIHSIMHIGKSEPQYSTDQAKSQAVIGIHTALSEQKKTFDEFYTSLITLEQVVSAAMHIMPLQKERLKGLLAMIMGIAATEKNRITVQTSLYQVSMDFDTQVQLLHIAAEEHSKHLHTIERIVDALKHEEEILQSTMNTIQSH